MTAGFSCRCPDTAFGEIWMADVGGGGRETAASSQGRPVRENDAGASTQNRSLACDADAGCRAGADNGVWKARFLEQDSSILARLPRKVSRVFQYETSKRPLRWE